MVIMMISDVMTSRDLFQSPPLCTTVLKPSFHLHNEQILIFHDHTRVQTDAYIQHVVIYQQTHVLSHEYSRIQIRTNASAKQVVPTCIYLSLSIHVDRLGLRLFRKLSTILRIVRWDNKRPVDVH